MKTTQGGSKLTSCKAKETTAFGNITVRNLSVDGINEKGANYRIVASKDQPPNPTSINESSHCDVTISPSSSV